MLYSNSRSSANLIIDSVVNQPSTRGPKPAGRESWAKERWAPRNAFRKARKLAARQKQQHQGAAETAMGSGHKAKVAKWAEEAAEKAKKQGEQETAEKATAEKTVSSERTREITWLPINSQFLPSPQYQQGDLAEYTNLGRREHPGTAYQTLCRAPNSVPARAMTWMSSRFAEELSSLSRTPQHMQDYISPYNDTHPIPARPGPASPINTARASPTVKSKYRRIQKAEEKKMETVEEAVERVRGERKKMEERKSTEEEREEFERERKKMDEEWKKVGRERKKMEKQRKKGGKKRMEEDEEEEM